MSAMAVADASADQRGGDTARWVPVPLLQTLQRRIARVNRRASKLGGGMTTLVVIRRVDNAALVRVESTPARRTDWTLVATLHHRAGRPTTVHIACPVERIDVEAWSRSEGWCEHCRTRRARTTTYLLRRFDGRLAQV